MQRELPALPPPPFVANSVGCTLACLFATACGGAPLPRGPTVADIDIIGNQSLDEKAILGGLATREPSGVFSLTRYRYDPLLVDSDIQRIQAFYALNGYFSAKVTDVEVEDVELTEEQAIDGERVDINFHVDEGARSEISNVRVSGVPDEVAPSEIALEIGTPFTQEAYESLKEDLLDRLRAVGYATAKLDSHVRVDRSLATARVDIAVHAGPKITFGETSIEGLEKVPVEAVENRIMWERGDLVTPEALAATRGRLQRLGLFGNVSVEYADSIDHNVANPTITLSEGRWRELRAGVGVGADDARFEARLRAGYSELGFLSPLMVLRIDVAPSYSVVRTDASGAPPQLGGRARAELSKEDFLYPLVRGVSRATYEVIPVEGYTRRGPGTALSVGRGFFRESLYVSSAWHFDYLTFHDVNQGLVTELDDPGRRDASDARRIGYFSQSISLDRRDELLDPHEGSYLNMIAEEGTAVAGGEDHWFKLIGEARGYLSFWSPLVLATRARYGRILSGRAPITQRFFGGGTSGHRGFAQRRLSPYVSGLPDGGMAPADQDGSGDGGVPSNAVRVPRGGDRELLLTLEVRYDAFMFKGGEVGFVAFVDAGDVTTRDIEPTPADLHWAVGSGLRYNTPVGPVRIDLGYRLRRLGDDEPDPVNRWVVHLSIGEAF